MEFLFEEKDGEKGGDHATSNNGKANSTLVVRYFIKIQSPL